MRVSLYTVFQKKGAFLFLSDLGQISTNLILINLKQKAVWYNGNFIQKAVV